MGLSESAACENAPFIHSAATRVWTVETWSMSNAGIVSKKTSTKMEKVFCQVCSIKLTPQKTLPADQKKAMRKLGATLSSAKRLRVTSFLTAGPLPVQDLCNVIAEYGAGLEGVRVGTMSHDHCVRLLTVLPNGTLVSVADDNAVRMWEAGVCVRTSEGLISHLCALDSLPDGRLVLGGGAGTVKVFEDGVPTTLTVDNFLLTALAVLPDGKVATGSHSNTVRVWENRTCVRELKGHTRMVTALASLPGGKLASGSIDTMVRVWGVAHGQCLHTLVGHTDNVTALVAVPHGKLASASVDGTVRVWDFVGGTCLLTLAGHTSDIWALAVLPGGMLASGSPDRTVRVWDADIGECVLIIEEEDEVNCLAVLHSGELAVGSYNQVNVYQ